MLWLRQNFQFPDKGNTKDSEEAAAVNQAREWLTDRLKRYAYDLVRAELNWLPVCSVLVLQLLNLADHKNHHHHQH